MTGSQYVLLAYAVGLALLLGYSLRLWLMSRRLAERTRTEADAGSR